MTEPTPIVVNPNPLPTQAWVAVRDVLKVAGGVLVTRGLVTDAQLETLVGAVLVVAPIIWAQYRARRDKAKMTLLAQAAPNSVGVVR